MHRRLREALSAVMLLGFCAFSCESEEQPRPIAGAGKTQAGEAGEDAGSAGNGSGASSSGGEGSSAAGAEANGGQGEAARGGAGAEAGGQPVEPGGGDGAGGMPEPSLPPDLVVSSGGPWPDSLTGACANASKAITCPRQEDPFFGQDGSYRINVPAYASTASTLTDSVSGLSWQLTSVGAQTQAQAVSHCEALELAGHTDWRLPSRLEYVSILDFGMGTGVGMPPGVAVETVGPHWTRSAAGTAADQFFIVNDENATWTLAASSTPFSARCVRGPAPSGALQVEAATTTDTMTELMWQTTDLDDVDLTWQEALGYCEALSHADETDWRLPSIKELATLVDDAASSAPVVRVGFGGGALRYWSSTPSLSPSSERFALTLDTSVGYSPSLKVTEASASARCVRTVK
jgi:hypothetical protein